MAKQSVNITDWQTRLLSVSQVAHILSISTSSVYRKVGLGELPPPKHIAGLPRWNGQELATIIGFVDSCENIAVSDSV